MEKPDLGSSQGNILQGRGARERGREVLNPTKRNTTSHDIAVLLPNSRQLSTKSLRLKKARTGQDLTVATRVWIGVGSAKLRFSTSWQCGHASA